MGFVISRSGVRVTPLAPSSRNNLDLLACRLRVSECCGFFMSPKLTLFPIDRFKGFQPTEGIRTVVLMVLRPILLSAPFLKAKRALFFSKILYKYYGAELVVSEKHRSGALFHFKELSSQKGGVVCQKHGNRRRVSKKGGARQMKKFSSGRKKGTVMSMSSLKSSVRRYHVTFKPKRPRKSR